MPYFDLHCHPGLKTLFQLQNGRQESPWENMNPKDGIIGNILESQASLKMLAEDSGVSLVCITLHPPEIGMIDQVIIKLAALLGYPTLLNRDRLEEMISQQCTYQMTFKQELANLMAAPLDEEGNPIKKNIKFLKIGESFDANIPETLQVIFNLEGGHIFYDQKNNVKDIAAVIGNLNDFLNKGFKVLYLTPTHLTPNQFITHAYGNKILTKGRLLPKGLGITPYGKQLIDHAYEKDLLIDVKHMSLVSRRIFYQYRRLHYPDKPIIASHVGFNGNYWKFFKDDILYQDQKSYGYKTTIVPLPGVIDGTFFYPLTINLYNDDIREILASGGLIGLNLDVRILGGKVIPNKDEKEFFSREEFELLTNQNVETLIAGLVTSLENETINNGDTSIDASNEEGQELAEIKDARAEIDEMAATTAPEHQRKNYTAHLRLILNHILHIYKFTKDEGLPSPWDHICIGSDFDGLVEAVDCCRNATEFEALAQSLTRELTKIVTDGFKYDLGLTPKQIIDKLMFSNAVEFINKHCK